MYTVPVDFTVPPENSVRLFGNGFCVLPCSSLGRAIRLFGLVAEVQGMQDADLAAFCCFHTVARGEVWTAGNDSTRRPCLLSHLNLDRAATGIGAHFLAARPDARGA